MSESLQTASALVAQMLACGVTEAVLAPGSRSAPLAYALADADAAGLLRLHVRVDERSAGFLALGLAKAARQPVPVVTTSGTAVAELHPAVLEAHHAGVPLLVLSADRPREVRHRGGNQTTVQPGIFAAALRAEWDLAGEDPREVVLAACAAARGEGGDPGPVHVNVPFDVPLQPDGPMPVMAAFPVPEAAADSGTVRGVAVGASGAAAVTSGASTMVLLGDLPDPADADRVASFAAAAGWPLVAEPFGSFDRALAIPSAVLDDWAWVEQNLPDRVLLVGRTTLSRSTGRLLQRVERVETIPGLRTWPDPTGRAVVVHPWSVLDVPPSPSADRSLLAAWTVRGNSLAGESTWGTAAAAIATVLEATEADLFVGPSAVVRHLDRWGCRDARTIWANRGLAGIDGCVSTALGIGLATRRPLVALLGDLTFLHEGNGLMLGAGEPVPDVTFVVLDNSGGEIFAGLEHGQVAERGEPEWARFERIFTTPVRTSVEAVAAAHGIETRCARTGAELAEQLGSGGGVRVVRVAVRG